MQDAMIYAALLWTAALLVIVRKIAIKKTKEGRIRKAQRLMARPDYTVILYPFERS